MSHRTEKKIEKELDRAEKEYGKAEKADLKGNTRRAEKHENRGMAHELRAEGLAGHGTALGAAGVTPVGLSSTYASGTTVLPGSTYTTGTTVLPGSTYTTGTTTVLPGSAYSTGQPLVYQGLSFPYQDTTAHPTYGYPRLAPNKKADRFEAKALEWERRGRMDKAQKNRNKALRYRQRTQPGYVPQPRPQEYYVNRVNSFDTRAVQYQQMGMAPQANRYQQRSLRMRQKHNITTQPLWAQQQPGFIGQPAVLQQGFVAQPAVLQQGFVGQQPAFVPVAVGQPGFVGQPVSSSVTQTTYTTTSF